MGDAKDRVWLVHGTWAHGIPSLLWSVLPRRLRPTKVDWPELRGALEASGCLVHDCVWSGHNSHHQRLAAGKKLATTVHDSRRVGDRVFLVSHSHGGNVALYAAKRLTPPPDGIVFLATPFLHLQAMELDAEAFKGLRGALTAVSFLATFIGWMVRTHETMPLPEAVTVFLGLGTAILAAWAVYRLVEATEKLVSRAILQARKASQEFQPALPTSPVLLMRKTGDEASAFLLTGQLAEWLTTVIWKLLAAALRMPDRLIGSLVDRHPRIAGGAFLAIVLVVLFYGDVSGIEDRVYQLVGYLLTFSIAAVLLVALLQLSLAALLMLLGWVRFGWGGWQMLFAPLLLKVTTEPVPAGSHVLHLAKGTGTSALAHSEIHHDKESIEQVVSWIAQTAGREPS